MEGASSKKRARAEEGGDAVEEGAKVMMLTAQNKALATNMYNYRRAVKSLEERSAELARQNGAMYALLTGLQGGLAQVRVHAAAAR
jgi:hypothetical protein